jgi:hypothetical protein
MRVPRFASGAIWHGRDEKKNAALASAFLFFANSLEVGECWTYFVHFNPAIASLPFASH